MAKTYFSVDVETTSTNAFDGELLTVGLVAIDAQSLKIVGELYVPLKYTGNHTDPETAEWWQDRTFVSQAAYDAAWGYENDRFATGHGASLIKDFVLTYAEAWPDRIFAANPASFDYPWIQKLYAEAEMPNPFHYRSICMRSLYFGVTDVPEWGESRESTGEFHKPRMPHHALEDARAQALDLILMLQKRRDRNRLVQMTGAKA